jgi:hypothetical protein
MRRSMRAMVGAGVMAMASVAPLAATAQATPATGATTITGATAATTITADATSSTSALAAGWQRRGPFTSYAACDRVRSQMVSLGYATQACYYLRCGAGCTTPGIVSGWYYLIRR